MSDSGKIIAKAIGDVQALRNSRQRDAAATAAVALIKRLQAQRFRATYADLLQDARYQKAAHFFLQELYSEADFAQRDEQFARIAAPLERLFPANVVHTAQALALLHAKTESLDDAMARAWLATADTANHPQRYTAAWRTVGRLADRRDQLAEVLHLGRDLDRLTRTLGLRQMLKMMRGPATLAGLSSLQQFLESGFDAFASMRGANAFLEIIDQRERAWLNTLFDEDSVTCETKLAQAFA
jgi:TPR repeat protein